MNPFMKYYQLECRDNKGGLHIWRFPFDSEGFRECCSFKSWLAYDPIERANGFHAFSIWHN